MPCSYEMIAATDIGQIRELNEDSLRIMPQINLAVVADGMGGHKAGDIASRLAVGSLCDYFQEQALIRDAIGGEVNEEIMSDAFALANSEVYANAHQYSNCEGMGTTLIAGSFQPDEVFVGHIGDSRLYRFAQGSLEQLTVDHTLATELSAETPLTELPAYAHHVLRKALGIESSCNPDFMTITPEKGQIFVMCSDGLTGVLSDQDIATALTLRAHQPEVCIDSMIRACNEQGAPDNISIVLIFVR